MPTAPDDAADLAIVGAGAAGLMAAIHAGRTAPGLRIVALDGAAQLGAKILIAGGGRCNVTHDVVDETAFAGSTRPAIRKVLRRFDVPATTAFFAALGVTLKREPTGKLFPVSDRARTVLDALLRAAEDAGVVLRHPWRVETLARDADGFALTGPAGALRARRVILATGGMSVPKTGSDGHGLALARRLGLAVTPRIFPALVPLTLPAGHPLLALAGVSADVRVSVHGATGATRAAFTGSLLCTHVGLSGPVVLDASRWFLDARADDPETTLRIAWLPDPPAAVDAWLLGLGRQHVGRALAARLPERLARTLCAMAGVDPATPGTALAREQRRTLVGVVTACTVPVAGHRGFTHAEVTAGGVPLRELRLETLETRAVPGLHLCGEICDVDGRIGGYNFQWAWASGFVAGAAAARALADPPPIGGD